MKKIIIFILFCLASVTSFAQSKHTDPRPLKGLDASKIPVLKSWKDIKPNPGGLMPGAVEIGKAELTTMDVGHPQMVGGDPKNQPSSTTSLWRIMRSANGTVNWMWHLSNKSGGIAPQSVSNPDGIEILNGVKNALRIADPKTEFYSMSVQTDEQGCKHLRYGQIYKGVPVWNRDLYIHLSPSGEPEIINGTYEPTPVNISTVPTLSNPYSIIIAIADLKAQNKWAPVGPDVAKVLGRGDPEAKLVLYPQKNGKICLAYEVSVIPNLLESYYYIVDATSGEILNKIARQCSVMPINSNMPPVTISHFATTDNGAPLQPQAGVFTNASGIDLNGVNQPLRTYQHTDGKFYTIWDLPSFVAGTSKLPDQPIGGAITLSTNTKPFDQNASLFHNTSTNNTWSDKVVVSAHHNTLVTYSYYSNTFQRKAIDDKNSLITSIIHVTNADGSGMDNAFWDGVSSMIYGDGHTDFKALAGGIDVAAHEMTHGVINSTCNLVYQDQSGALNESFADVFGVLVDTRNLTVGEDIMKDGKSCLRNLDNPHDPTALDDEPAKFSEYVQGTQDNGGVHTNSAITSKACAILINQLGRPTVQKIYYLAMTKYLTRNSQFIDCRLAIQAAAKEIFTANSTEFKAVGPAFDAVEIFDATGTDPGQNDVPGQKGGTSLIAFTNDVGDVGVFNLRSNKFGLFSTAGSTARVSQSGTSRAQITAPKSGAHLWYISSTGHLSVLDIVSGIVNFFPTLHVKTGADGDLWNCAVSPDESFVAFTSAYLNDPNIYIYDLANDKTFIQPLTPESNDGGAIASIDYPDVVSFSPNNAIPRISFDALLDANVGGTSVQYWSMYEINYTSNKTYELFPSQGSEIDLGNVAYSNTSPSLITFNSIQNGTDWDVWVADFKNNNTGFLGIDQRTINGNPILDAQKPSFSPHDDSLVFASPSNNSLLFYAASNQNLSFIQFPAPVFQPYWFTIGGTSSGVHADSKATNAIGLAVYPSVTSRTATATITLAASEDVTLDILNIFGMTVRKITKEMFDAGSHEVKFDIEGLSSGTYLVRLATKDGQKMEKIIMGK